MRFGFRLAAWFLWLLVATCLPGPVLAGEDDVLRPALDSYHRELNIAHVSLNNLESRLKTEVDTMSRRATSLGKKRDQLVLLFGSAQNPWDLRDVAQANSLLLAQAESVLSKPETLDLELQNSIRSLRDTEAKIETRLQESVTPEVESDLRSLLADINVLADRITATREELGRGIRPVRELQKSLKIEEEKLRTELKTVWTAYYSERTPTLFSRYILDVVHFELEQWMNWFEFVIGVITGESQAQQVRQAILHSLGLTFAVALGGLAFFRRLGAGRSAPPFRRALRHATLCVSVAVGLGYLASTLNAVVYSLVLGLSEASFSAGLVFLSKFFTLFHKGRPDEPKTATRWPLWAVFSLGLMLQSMRAPDIVMQPFMALVFLALAWRIKRQGLNSRLWLDRFLAGLCTTVLPTLAVLALAGFCRAAVLAASALFYFVLCVRFSNAVIGLLDAWQETMAGKWSPVAMGLVSGVGFPLVFLCSFSLCLWLGSSQFEGQRVFLDALSFEAKFEAFAISAGRLALVLFGYYLLKSAIHATNGLLAAYGETRNDLEPGAVESLQTISSYAWWALFLLLSLYVLGFSFTSLAVVAGGLSVGIGFGLQQIVNNFLSGLILLFGRSVEVGDVLQMGDTTGVVQRVNIRNTVVQTYDNATIFIPNSSLVSTQIINWSHRDRRVRREVNVGVAYGSDRNKVRDLLVRAALSVPEVLRDPPPNVLFWDFGASTLDFKLRIWIADVEDGLSIQSRVREAIGRLFDENDVEIAFPQTDIHLRTAPALEKLGWKRLSKDQGEKVEKREE
ncbi:mechanosensitive ion channel [Fundidesulfovibrio butyratiphilus]